MAHEIAAVRRDIAATQAQLADTVAELEGRVKATVGGVKRTLDVVETIRAHPWPALALAFGAGVTLSVSDNDRKALSATARVGKRAPRATASATASAARVTADAARRASALALAAAMRTVSRDGDSPEGGDGTGGESGGVVDRLWDLALGSVSELIDEMRAASLAINAPPAPASRTAAPHA
jgi:hypothetical protein